jgi:hypothetical protein
MPIPLYGFLQGDTVGLLIFAEPEDSMRLLASRLTKAARLRVAVGPEMELQVLWRGAAADAAQTVASLNVRPLDRFDVVVRRT